MADFLPLPEKEYSVIYADPPWEYRQHGTPETSRGTALKQTPTMPPAYISKLPLRKICGGGGAACFLWATFPNIAEGIRVLEAWGFQYKTAAFVWVKKNAKSGTNFWGMGAYTRANAEVCLLGVSPGFIETVEPKSAGSDASQFLKMQWRLIGAGQGMSYEATSRDMSESNYSSARQGANEDEATFAAEIELLTEIMSEIYETFVISCYLTGLINPPGFWDKKADYLAHKWVQAPKKWIDPAKETTATKTALATGQKTFQDVAAEQGKDWKEAVDEMAEVLKYGRKAGIEMGGVIYGQGAAAQQNAGTQGQEPGNQEHGGNPDPTGGGAGQPPENS